MPDRAIKCLRVNALKTTLAKVTKALQQNDFVLVKLPTHQAAYTLQPKEFGVDPNIPNVLLFAAGVGLVIATRCRHHLDVNVLLDRPTRPPSLH